MTAEEIDTLILSLPGAERGTVHGRPCWRVAGKFLARLRSEDDSLALDVGDHTRRDMLIEVDPDVFHLTDHYRPYAYVLIRIARVDPAWLRTELMARWRRIAPVRLRKLHSGLT